MLQATRRRTYSLQFSQNFAGWAPLHHPILLGWDSHPLWLLHKEESESYSHPFMILRAALMHLLTGSGSHSRRPSRWVATGYDVRSNGTQPTHWRSLFFPWCPLATGRVADLLFLPDELGPKVFLLQENVEYVPFRSVIRNQIITGWRTVASVWQLKSTFLRE